MQWQTKLTLLWLARLIHLRAFRLFPQLCLPAPALLIGAHKPSQCLLPTSHIRVPSYHVAIPPHSGAGCVIVDSPEEVKKFAGSRLGVGGCITGALGESAGAHLSFGHNENKTFFSYNLVNGVIANMLSVEGVLTRVLSHSGVGPAVESEGRCRLLWAQHRGAPCHIVRAADVDRHLFQRLQVRSSLSPSGTAALARFDLFVVHPGAPFPNSTQVYERLWTPSPWNRCMVLGGLQRMCCRGV